jgi:hypothetical protein
MADSNNHRAAHLPAKPNVALKQFHRIVGTWKESGGYNGTSAYEWMEGEFFLIHHFDGMTPGGRHVKGVEYIGFDEDTGTLRSHLMDNHGSNFTYTYEMEGDVLTSWFGDKGSGNFYTGRFSQDGNTITGRWQWPEGKEKTGGFEVTSTRISG